MRTRIRCPFHIEQTPSLIRRKSDWRCYGACNKVYTIEEVAAKGFAAEYTGEEDEYKEDLEEKFRYIESLKRQEIRGLKLPADERGYFICWPDCSYYKYRLYSGKPKYLSPKGHKPSLFRARTRSQGTLWLVEGECNALSLAKVMESDSVASPGSATNFNSDNLSKYLTELKQYSKINIVLDNDAAGIKGLIEAKAFFMYKVPFCNFYLLDSDVNEMLCDGGEEKVREVLQRTAPR